MASVRPFAALRPRPELAGSICELPYDVMTSAEARELAAGNRLSFLRVSKPEIDLPEGTDPYSEAVYAKGRANLDALRREGALVRDLHPAFHVYRQTMGGHVQTGVAAVFSCQEYEDGHIRRHELTRPDKENDRVRHIEALDAQTGPAFLTYRASGTIDALVARVVERPAAIDFTAADGVRHTAWAVTDAGEVGQMEGGFGAVPRLYIADGHHRSAAAARVSASRGGRGGSDRFMAVVFPHNQLQILPYNRVLKDLNGLSVGEVLERLEGVGEVAAATGGVPAGPREVRFYLGDRWRALRFGSALGLAGAALDRLDVALLQRHVLEPVFGIADPRTSERIGFVGGIRGVAELERLVGRGDYACTFSMHPTGIEELMAIADAGGVMPPKSTWFEPKLRDGLFSHVLG